MFSSGDLFLKLCNNAHCFFCAIGITLLENQNAPKQINTMKIINERIIRKSDTPADFIASNSNFSPISPKDINDANSMANGNANGTNDNHE